MKKEKPYIAINEAQTLAIVRMQNKSMWIKKTGNEYRIRFRKFNPKNDADVKTCTYEKLRGCIDETHMQLTNEAIEALAMAYKYLNE